MKQYSCVSIETLELKHKTFFRLALHSRSAVVIVCVSISAVPIELLVLFVIYMYVLYVCLYVDII